MLRIYGIKNCDTMKKAMAWLDAQDIAYQFVDYKAAGVVDERLPHWMAAVGWETLLNRRGQTWRKLADADRADVDAAKAAHLMIATPTLIKRPVLESGNEVVVGFDVDRYTQLFCK